jgi:hypothetical protein
MNSIDILTVSTIAYIIAFAILMLLAIMMRLITFVFPERKDSGSATVVAAITGTYHTLFPGGTVTKIEETK